MVKYRVLACLLVCSVMLAQNEDTTKIYNPCDVPIIKKARTVGLRSLALREILSYYLAAYKCKRTGNSGDKIKKIETTQIEKDYQNSRSFQGWTSTCATCTAVVVVLFYIEKTFSKK